MRVTKKIRTILEKMAKNSMENRELNRQLNAELEKNGVDIDNQELENCIAYVEGDGDITPIIDYLELNITNEIVTYFDKGTHRNTDLKQEVMRLRAKGQSYALIGRTLGYSRQRIHQIIKESEENE